MKYNPNKHHRRSIRLKNYNYASPGIYFVTICVKNRKLLFGTVVNGIMQLNEAGQMIQHNWEILPERFPNIRMDEFMVMPNHFHGLLVIESKIAPGKTSVLGIDGLAQDEAYRKSPPTLGDMIGAFKSITTNLYIKGVRQQGWLSFDRQLWQRNYWEHIIRNQTELDKIRQYIQTNPQSWDNDQLHPDAPPNKFNT